MNNFTLDTFTNNGIRLHFHQQGKGPSVLFIPGSISDYRTWSGLIPTVANHFTCTVISRRYQYPDTYPQGGNSSVAENTLDVAAFIRSRGNTPVHVVGHSFGGFIALNLAIQFPDLVSCVTAEEPIFAPILARNPKNPLELLHLLLKNPKAGLSFGRLGMKGIDPTFKALGNGDLQSAQITFIDGVTAGQKTPDTLDKATREQLLANIASLAGEDPFINTIGISDLSRIKCPVLLINGTKSPYVFRYINNQLKKQITNSKIRTIPNAGHWVHIDQPDQFSSEVISFLRQTEKAT